MHAFVGSDGAGPPLWKLAAAGACWTTDRSAGESAMKPGGGGGGGGVKNWGCRCRNLYKRFFSVTAQGTQLSDDELSNKHATRVWF
jgi:hypothetical protein